MTFSTSVAGRLSLSVVFCCLAGYSAKLSAQNSTAAPLVGAARVLEKNRNAFEASQLAALTRSEAMHLAQVSCRSDLLRPALSVALVAASQADQKSNYDSWSDAVLRADNLARHMIRCMPSEANAWIRQALLSRAIAENPRQLADIIDVAAALGPFEKIQLQARVAFWRRASQETLDLSHDTLRMDIRTVLRHGDKQVIELLLADTPPNLVPVVNEEIADLDETARSRVLAVQSRLKS